MGKSNMKQKKKSTAIVKLTRQLSGITKCNEINSARSFYGQRLHLPEIRKYIYFLAILRIFP